MEHSKENTFMETRQSKVSSMKTDSSLSASLLAGSQEFFDFYCEPCSVEDLHIEAVGFCQNCMEYLCDTCCRYHRRLTATRHHMLLNNAEMRTSIMAAKPKNHLKEKCPKHQNKLLEYYCNSHGVVCCIVCLNMDHGSCNVISYIPNVSDGIASSNEYNHLMTELKALVSKLTKQQNMVKLCCQDNDKYQSESLTSISSFRKEVDKIFDKFERNSVMMVSKLHNENAEKIIATTSKCQVMLSELTAIITNLAAEAKSGNNNKLFVDIKISRQRLSEIEAEASDVTNCRITQYGFHQDERIKEIMSTLSAVWSLSIRQYDEQPKARYIGDVNVKSDDDTVDCTIDGIASLPGGDFVVTDSGNKALKLVNMKQNKVTYRLPLSSQPGDVINTNYNQVAVSLGREGNIEIYTATDVLSKSNTIHVREPNFDGICYAKDLFILTYYGKGLVKIVDISGRVLSTISTDQNGGRLFTTAKYIAVGRDGDIAYVTDLEAHTVTTMTLGGHIISVFRNDELKKPRGVTVGPNHKLYVCSSHTHSVLQLSATGEFQQVLLDKQRGLSSFPAAITYDDTRDRLYISSGRDMAYERNHITFFQIE